MAPDVAENGYGFQMIKEEYLFGNHKKKIISL